MTDMTETITWHRADEAMPDEGSFALVIRRKNTDPLEGWCGTALMSKGMWWGGWMVGPCRKRRYVGTFADRSAYRPGGLVMVKAYPEKIDWFLLREVWPPETEQVLIFAEADAGLINVGFLTKGDGELLWEVRSELDEGPEMEDGKNSIYLHARCNDFWAKMPKGPDMGGAS